MFSIVLSDHFHPLGMSSGDIPDSAITSSSTRLSDLFPYDGRLHWTKKGRDQAWAIKELHILPIGTYWLQIDLGQMNVISGVATQKRHAYIPAQYVTKYRLSHSNDSVTWIDYLNKKVCIVFKSVIPK